MRTRSLFATAAPLAIALGALCALAAPAAATFHLTRLVQVYGGDATHPDAQYVVLQACTTGQTQLAGHSFEFFDASGGQVGELSTFAGPPANTASQARFLVATSTAEILFGITADIHMAASLRPAGGKVCFDVPSPIDCVGWGAYTALPDASIGTPFDTSGGLSPGFAIQRDLAIQGSPSQLDCVTPNFDDTNQSAGDFDAVAPTPVNNANAAGVIDSTHLFLHGFEAGKVCGWSSVSGSADVC